MRITISIFALVSMLVTGLAQAQTQVPNDFQAGTPARATEVNENFDALEAAIDQNTTAISQIPAGPEGPQGEIGLQGPQGVQGPQGPAGADLSTEVNIIEGEQAVQNDRIDALESNDHVEECKLGRWIFGAELFDANGRTNVILIGIQSGTGGASFTTEGGGLCLRGTTCTNVNWTFLGTCL